MPLLCSDIWLALINEVMQELIVILSIHRYSPTLARQWVCGCVPQGPFLSPVGVQSGSAAVTQGAWVPDPENLGWSVTSTTWRGETGSSYCWRQVFPLLLLLDLTQFILGYLQCTLKTLLWFSQKRKLLVNGQQIICSHAHKHLSLSHFFEWPLHNSWM